MLSSLTLLLLPYSIKSFQPNVLSSSKFLGNTKITTPKNKISTTKLMFMYDTTFDPPNNKKDDTNNIWTALASTEKWIDETLNGLTNNAKQQSNDKSNPYSRKEVSYVCEPSENMEEIVSGIFRRLKEGRETGDEHGQREKKIAADMGPHRYKIQTLRETLVIVMPSCDEITSDFHTFNELIQRINTARRNARDFQHTTTQIDEDENDKWMTSVSMSHLHPEFGKKTPKEMLQDEINEDDGEEIDLNLLEYKKKKLLARRSPYPTVVMEVRSNPPIHFASPDARDGAPSKARPSSSSNDAVSSNDLMKLEALFGKEASFEHPDDIQQYDDNEDEDNDDDFYAKIGAVSGIQEMSTPTYKAQLWVATHLQSFDALRSSFHILSKNTEVDEAYEFIFQHINAGRNDIQEKKTFLVFDEFCRTSATSFEKFKNDVQYIMDCIPTLVNKVTLDIYHPEHVDKDKRAPMPIFVLHWIK